MSLVILLPVFIGKRISGQDFCGIMLQIFTNIWLIILAGTSVQIRRSTTFLPTYVDRPVGKINTATINSYFLLVQIWNLKLHTLFVGLLLFSSVLIITLLDRFATFFERMSHLHLSFNMSNSSSKMALSFVFLTHFYSK